MLLLAADENFNNDILRGLLRRNPGLDIVRVQDVGLRHAPDPIVLEWAAQEGRVLLTHDRNTVTKYAYERVIAGKPMPGVIEVDRLVPLNLFSATPPQVGSRANAHARYGIRRMF